MTALPHIPAPAGTATQRRWKVIFVVLLLAVPALLVTWIVSGSGHPATAPAASCRAVSAALANGPDPDVDPVGYAEAQVRPLREITTSDPALHVAILQLSSAYESFYRDDGASSKQVSAAEKNIDAYCPGATS